ncbi:hypothetical protein [Streptomyces sudanensis]|uniref:hypothetical protein n=1 Tax=Streptomyces sudanensis TaxID=436397 RepID=UPI0020CB9F61|nr:hypothetical protein [Streptomyces sudanensis]MCQ0003181.1 hypothetical protein [Streptomyces sudanensis]
MGTGATDDGVGGEDAAVGVRTAPVRFLAPVQRGDRLAAQAGGQLGGRLGVQQRPAHVPQLAVLGMPLEELPETPVGLAERFERTERGFPAGSPLVGDRPFVGLGRPSPEPLRAHASDR